MTKQDFPARIAKARELFLAFVLTHAEFYEEVYSTLLGACDALPENELAELFAWLDADAEETEERMGGGSDDER